MIRLYYSINDRYPAYRVDLSELVAHSLKDLGVNTEWYMARDAQAGASERRSYLGQVAHVPAAWNSWWGRRLNRLSYWLADWAGIARAGAGQFDVIQVRDKYLASLVALVVARASRKKFVYWCSFPYPEFAVEMGEQTPGFKGWLLRTKGRLAAWLLYRVIMPAADHCFVQSEQMREDLADYGIPLARMTSVPMGVPPRLLEWTRERHQDIVPQRIVYLGTLAAVRRLDEIVRAFALVKQRCPQATLVMVGEGDTPDERFALEALVRSMGLADSVTFTGFVPIEQAWDLAASASVCLSPFYPTKILASTSPTKLIEYMALGRPVVCNDHPEQSAIIRDSGAGICTLWGAEHFADAIVSLLDYPEQAEAMAARGPGWVAAHRTYTVIARKVHARYREIVGARG